MTWYLWVALIIVWLVVGILVFSFGSYIAGRLQGIVPSVASPEDFVFFIICVLLWPINVLFIGALIANRFGQIGKEHRKQDQG